MEQLQKKWKNIKSDVRRQASLAKQIGGKTGSGQLTAKEKRIVESASYRDAALRMGISATGNVARFDSDSQDSNSSVACHSRRLKRVRLFVGWRE